MRKYLLRLKPPSERLHGAHAVDREAAVLAKLGAAFSGGACLGPVHRDSVIGTWLFVMEMLEDRIFWEATFPNVSREARLLYLDAMNATLASSTATIPLPSDLATTATATSAQRQRREHSDQSTDGRCG